MADFVKILGALNAHTSGVGAPAPSTFPVYNSIDLVFRCTPQHCHVCLLGVPLPCILGCVKSSPHALLALTNIPMFKCYIIILF